MTTKKAEMEICTLNDLLFPVEINDNPRHTNSEYCKVVTGIVPIEVPFHTEEQKAIITNGLNEETAQKVLENFPKTKIIQVEKDLNYCSERYELIPNSTIFPVVEEIFNQNNINFSVTYQQRDNARFYAEYVLEDEKFAYKINGTNDVIKFRFSFQHSYNGQTKYMGVAGFYRLVCSNGLTISVKEMDEYNLQITGKHTASIKDSLIQFNDLLNKVVNNLDTVKNAVAKQYEGLAAKKVSDLNKRVEDVLTKAKIIIVENNKFNIYSYIKNIVQFEMFQLGYTSYNDWLIYNAINRYIYDNDLNITAPEKRRELDSKVLEYMLAS